MEEETPPMVADVATAAAGATAVTHATQSPHQQVPFAAADVAAAMPGSVAMDAVEPHAAASVPTASAAAAAAMATLPSTTTPSEPSKKTGRPAHPLWAHFHRGEKRNRYHYHSFCVYCVERYGAEHVPPTRGVSIDMLRHLEKCSNCPRDVVEHLKEVCGQRDAVRYDRYGKKKAQQAEGLLLQAQQENAAAAAQHAQLPCTAQAPDAAAAASSAASAATSTAHRTAMASSTASAATTVTFSGATRSPRLAPTASGGAAAAPAAKRLRVDQPPASSPVCATEFDDKVAVLKLAVAAGLSAEALQNAEFQQLLCLLRPSLAPPSACAADTFAGLLEPAFLKESAARLAAAQLDRVKEGMLNSTIKGGLTLSLHSWTTRDRQHLVAFNLVNSNGDSACVGVEDMAHYQPSADASPSIAAAAPTGAPYTSHQLAAKIEDVLTALQRQNISVMGIVADSTLALNAARRVCATVEARRALLVVPCFARVLSVLAGAVLTHPHFVNVVSEMLEIAAYLLNTKLLDEVRALSGDAHASFVLPNRENWFSFVECHARLLRHRDAIVRLCLSGEVTTPHILNTLVLRDNQAVWKRLEELGAFLAPLHETYSVFFQQLRTTVQHDGSRGHAAHATATTTTSVDILEDDLAAAHGLTLAHVMYQFARMTQQYQTLLLSVPGPFATSNPAAAQDVAQLVLIHVDAMWRRYELPAMLLAFVFNFHLDTTLLDMSKPCSAWASIAQYFQIYFARWFGGDRAVSDARTAEILDAIKLSHFPFDAATTSDYIDVSSFYSFVSDSHPEICALCCRIYAISLLTANASRIVRGIGYVPIAAQTTREPASVELVLHVGFASSMRRNVFSPLGGDASSALGGMGAMLDGASDAVLWSEDVWQVFADDWRLFVDQELLMDEFDAISHECGAADPEAALLAVKVPVQELFVDTLPAMTVTLEAPAAAHASAIAHSHHVHVTSGGVLSVGI